ncbi:glycosyltransferase involved in cell wall biosynthesis [Sphingomonas vulcanisoli]|uniref:Glycosyltransferase involved in cell wall biosynthesis n=1 Tax=Sphingomonas vulcanisoli TaxID=1658060 RepID=A0ABX0TSL4_9SPHN|nr:glycosyltransferase [Sphingomonas vulcanisoli]NIJ08073.1 glycosyltransferase involved in cell wall biosynthesis [Sphingomonas vulcanisoli]
MTKPIEQARVALIHYWLVGEAGGEKVVSEILRLFPQADVFTLIHDPAVSAKIAPGHKVTTSFLQKLPGVGRYYRKLLPLMPMAIESLDLRGYDLILSSESGPAKGVIAPIGALHVCYCHSPMRYLWDQAHEYAAESGRLTRWMMTFFGPRLRMWDYTSAQRVDAFVANSSHISRRIAAYYRRPSTVIHPPVDVDAFATSGAAAEDFYLIGGRHVGYKRIDLAIAAANARGRRLIITGEGPETARLRKLAGPTVEFRGQVPRAELAWLYANCRAFLMPGEEDFGITPIEAMAAGRPVIAYARGGALDSVIPGLSGLLFEDQSAEGLNAAIERLEAQPDQFDSARIRAHAEGFSAARFRDAYSALVRQLWSER